MTIVDSPARLVCDFNRSGIAFETAAGQPLPPCEAEAVAILVENGEVVRAICAADHSALARDEHPEATEYRIEPVIDGQSVMPGALATHRFTARVAGSTTCICAHGRSSAVHTPEAD